MSSRDGVSPLAAYLVEGSAKQLVVSAVQGVGCLAENDFMDEALVLAEEAASNANYDSIKQLSYWGFITSRGRAHDPGNRVYSCCYELLKLAATAQGSDLVARIAVVEAQWPSLKNDVDTRNSCNRRGDILEMSLGLFWDPAWATFRDRVSCSQQRLFIDNAFLVLKAVERLSQDQRHHLMLSGCTTKQVAQGLFAASYFHLRIGRRHAKEEQRTIVREALLR